MEILWHREEGECAWCGECGDSVRGYSDGKRYTVCCFACWDAQQDGCILGVQEWAEDTAYVFADEQEARRDEKEFGTAQGAFPN